MAAPSRKPDWLPLDDRESREAGLRRDLEARGLSASLAASIAPRLTERAADLSPEAYASFLDGVAAASGAPAQATPDGEPAAEIQRLVQDFAVELKKLDEGLRLLSAYLLRIRDRTRRETSPSRLVH